MTLSHDVAGDGPAVLLLHSGVCDRRMWDPQWPALIAAGRRVIRCDLRGFGDTPAATHPYRDADDVLDLIDSLGVETTVLVGSSYGGEVALEIAARSPERITGLALLCPAVPGHEPGPELEGFAHREDELLEAGDIDGAVELNLGTWIGPDADDTTRQKVRAMQRHAFDVQLAAGAPDEDAPDEGDEADGTGFETALAAVKARCLVVSGAHDLQDFRRIAARIPELLPDARHLELDWAGHLPSLERPDETTALLLRFLEDMPAAG
ncbi:alpha/beta fold hydrolase [Streptomyces meridianus]|uniref:Alpha/beta hydrolase n=1 Tax=Streptomyces meridianus TaxID=2938945 RepID=A0ABT0XBH0_9ACTN|nr:alpha/beta hydrolase [Streptomyces meridianus]MCM2579862.1 alpha/beta hydrolase [Streptomyces meridianus]